MVDIDYAVRSGGQNDIDDSGGTLINFGNDSTHSRPKYLWVQAHPDNAAYVAVGMTAGVVSSTDPGTAKGLQLKPGQTEILSDIHLDSFYAHAQNATDGLMWMYQV